MSRKKSEFGKVENGVIKLSNPLTPEELFKITRFFCRGYTENIPIVSPVNWAVATRFGWSRRSVFLTKWLEYVCKQDEKVSLDSLLTKYKDLYIKYGNKGNYYKLPAAQGEHFKSVQRLVVSVAYMCLTSDLFLTVLRDKLYKKSKPIHFLRGKADANEERL